ncbi:MAG: sulfotransferase [Cyanophyceae cyanobacterium]
MALPNFVMAGVQKAGSTSIWSYLGQHPQVYLPRVKEIGFLEREFEPSQICSRSAYTVNFDSYKVLFDGVKDEIAIGDGTVNCLFHHQSSIPRIQQYLDNPKVFAILRHPVERAFSDYLMHIRDVVSSKVLPLSQQSSSSFQLRKGLYSQQVLAFKEAFGDRFQVYLYDDLKADSGAFMKQIYDFLGIDESFVPDVSRKQQRAAVPKSKSINQLLRGKNPIRSGAAEVLRLFVNEEQRQRLRNSLISLNDQGKEKAALKPDEREYLINYFREDVLALQELLNRDLSAWLE